ncbi:MAG: MucR family transcriptional regulator, partial [Methylobacterium sp.]
MNETSYGKSSNFTELAVDLVAAYVANNPVPTSELPALIARVYGAIKAGSSLVGTGLFAT